MITPNESMKAKAGGAAGAVAGTTAGLAGSAAAISSAGTIAGLSGAGITSGLTAIGGSIFGGAALLSCGVAVLAVGGAYAGYKVVSSQRNSGKSEIDENTNH